MVAADAAVAVALSVPVPVAVVAGDTEALGAGARGGKDQERGTVGW